jgi:replicative DNA helicase
LAIVRLISGFRITETTRQALRDADPHVWGDLADYLDQSPGLTTPEKRLEAVFNQLKRLADRGKKVLAKSIQDALAVALEIAKVEGLRDEPEERPARRPFVDRIKGVTEFVRADYRLAWAVRRMLVFGQPVVIGAPKKSMKTSVMFDLAVSLAAGVPFLGQFDVVDPTAVLIISGESGGYVMQETILRVCRAKGIDPEVLEGRLFIGDELPQLGLDEDMEALAEFIRTKAVKVVIIDPLYLCLIQGTPGRRLDPSNLFDVGPLLLQIARTCLDAGATPILVHHFKKNGADPHDLPELEELAYAGIQEFARQWILLKRRERFVPGSGVHRLWLAVGGSAGHSGEWALDIEEGVMDDNFRGRGWDVTVTPATEAREQAAQGRQAHKAEQDALKVRQKEEARSKTVRDDAVTALRRLEGLFKTLGRPLSKTEWKDGLAGWDSKRFGPALAFLSENSMVEATTFTRPTNGRGDRTYDGFRPTPTDSRIQPDDSRIQPDHPAKVQPDRQPDEVGASSPVGGDPNFSSGCRTEPTAPPPPNVDGRMKTNQSPLNRRPGVQP